MAATLLVSLSQVQGQPDCSRAGYSCIAPHGLTPLVTPACPVLQCNVVELTPRPACGVCIVLIARATAPSCTLYQSRPLPADSLSALCPLAPHLSHGPSPLPGRSSPIHVQDARHCRHGGYSPPMVWVLGTHSQAKKLSLCICCMHKSG